MKEFFKVLKVVLGILVALCIVLFVVYFWNLDQKVLGWAYKQVNTMFDRKECDPDHGPVHGLRRVGSHHTGGRRQADG